MNNDLLCAILCVYLRTICIPILDGTKLQGVNEASCLM